MPPALGVIVPKAIQRGLGVAPGITFFPLVIVEVFIDVSTVCDSSLIFHLWKIIQIYFRNTFKLFFFKK